MATKKAAAKPADEPGTEVVTHEPATGAVTAMPDLREMSQTATQQFDKDELTIPFFRVVQSNSPQCSQGDPKFKKEARPGMFYNTVTDRLYNLENEGVVVIPVVHQTSYTEWKPRGAGGGQGKGFVKDWGSDPRGAGPTKRNEKNKDILANGNELTRSSVYYCLVIDGQSFQHVALVLAGTQLKKARTWNTFMKDLRFSDDRGEYNPSIFAQAYRITTVPESNDDGNWMGVKIEPFQKTGDLPNGAVLLQTAYALYQMAARGAVKTEAVEVEATVEGDDEAF